MEDNSPIKQKLGFSCFHTIVLRMLNLRKKASQEEVLHELLPKLLAKNAPNSVPLTGEAAQSNDCYSIHFGTQYWAQNYDLSTRMLDVHSADATGTYNTSEKVALSTALQHPLKVTYFYKTYWHDYTDIYRLSRDYKTRWIQIEVRSRIFWKNLSQWFFNRKPLWVIRDQMDLLEFIIERHIGPEGSMMSSTSNNSDARFSSSNLMTELKSSRWFYHPHSCQAKRRLDLLLDAFVDSKDLVKDGAAYTVAPRAIQMLSVHQENKRRHDDAIKTQRRIVLFTIIIAIATTVQAYYAANPEC
jgi:hypothetical protein